MGSVDDVLGPQDFTQGETFESSTQLSDSFSSLPAVGGRTTSRFSSFTISTEGAQPQHELRPLEPPNPLSGPTYADDHEDDVLDDILAMTSDPSQAMSPPRQIDRLTSRFAQQSLAPESSNYGAFGAMGPFDADPIRRDSASVSQFFPGAQRDPKTGLFEHPVVPAQPALPPAPPQTTRVMIMADKLKWVYKDPHGNVQGPFTGLEMHEWYRGGYFHATLEVKREDDLHFEPLQNLVKRIGNQREPFLVPLPSKTQTQVIPPRSTTTLSGWNTTLFGEGIEEQKPWVAPVPTIAAAALTGTTLTADQQNALERRKQEEQYMLVRQRELASQQTLAHPPILPLHHTTPQHFAPSPSTFGGYNPMLPLPMGVTHHVHTPAPVQVQTLPALDTLRTGGSVPTVPSPGPLQPMESPMERRHGMGFQAQPVQPSRAFISPWGQGPLGPLSPGMVQMEQMRNQDTFLPQQQLAEESMPNQFPHEHKMSIPAEPPVEVNDIPTAEAIAPETTEEMRQSEVPVVSPKPAVATPVFEPEQPQVEEEEAPQEQETVYETESPELPEDSLDGSALSISAAPSPARVAPWATPQNKLDPQKTLTLKQIQEIEAKRAAEQAKRIAAERQILFQQQAAAAAAAQPPPQQGLPQGSTWGSVAAKGWTAKPVAPSAPSPGKKTMAQIQKEEEEAAERNKTGRKDITTLAPSVKGYAGVAATAGTAKVLSFYLSY